MQHKKYWLVGLGAVVVGVGVVAGVLFLPQSKSISVPAPLAAKPVVVENKSDGYYFSKPRDWYLERDTGASVVLYPNYPPDDASSSAPMCKIEISSFAFEPTSISDIDNVDGDAVGDLDAWVTENLHADPTADVVESSREPLEVASASALQWRGNLNGVTTTLVYAQANGKVVEFAPVALNGADGAGDACKEDMLRDLLAGFHFGIYAR